MKVIKIAKTSVYSAKKTHDVQIVENDNDATLHKTHNTPALSPSDVINPKQQAFIAAYIANGWNATAAAKSARYGAPSVRGSQLLRNIKVRRAINAALSRHNLSAEQVLARLSEMASCNVADFADENGNFVWSKVAKKGYLVKKRTRKVYTAQNGDSVVEDTFEFHDAQVALFHVGKALGLFGRNAESIGIKDVGFEFALKITPEEMP